MKIEDFAKLLKSKDYKYYKKNGVLIITHQGSVDLRSCTSLPENIKFENQGSVYLRSCTSLPENIKFENQGSVDLESCTSLPENIKFENQGSVYLESCTSLPENIKFENQGSVDLRSCTSLPENIKFENQGSVDLRSCTSLPENIKFENQGSVYLRSCTSLPENIKFENQGSVYLKSCTSLPENIKFENQGSVYLESCTSLVYRGKKLTLKYIDGYSMIIESQKTINSFTIYNARYFKGGEIKKLPKCVIAEKDGYFAHGKSTRQAIEDVNFKFLQNNLDVENIVENIKKKQTINKNEYRLLTGACSLGVENFKKDNNIELDELFLEKALELTRGHYGYEAFSRLLGN